MYSMRESGNLFDAQHVGKGHGGAASGGLDQQILHALGGVRLLLLHWQRRQLRWSALMVTPAFTAMAPGSRIKARSALPSTVAPE